MASLWSDNFLEIFGAPIKRHNINLISDVFFCAFVHQVRDHTQPYSICKNRPTSRRRVRLALVVADMGRWLRWRREPPVPRWASLQQETAVTTPTPCPFSLGQFFIGLLPIGNIKISRGGALHSEEWILM